MVMEQTDRNGVGGGQADGLDGEAVVCLQQVGRLYRLGSIPVTGLRDVSLVVRRRTFSMVVGASGSGKSTLLNLVGCIDRPTSGRVFHNGVDVSALSDDRLSDFRARSIGFIFQSFNLIPVLSAAENIEYPLLLTRMSMAERRARVGAMLEAVDLTDKRHHRPNALSGGQRQRIAIARALVSQPALVLADEPTANLDSRTGAAIISLMHEMQARQDTTFLFSTHDPAVMEHADEVFYLRDGHLVETERRTAA